MAKRKGSFLAAFRTVGEAITAASQIAAPVVATLDPQVGALMMAATASAVGIEAAISEDGRGAQKADAVALQTRAGIEVVNAILRSQGKPELPANASAVIASQVGVVVAQLNAVRDAVQPVGADPNERALRPPINASTFRHEFKPGASPDLCGECGGGVNHAVHKGGAHARPAVPAAAPAGGSRK